MSVPLKHGLHPRNRFRGGYDFDALMRCSPALARFVARNAHGNASIDFADPQAVKALNQALLAEAYQLRAWDIPPGTLCPPIPGRSDQLHHLADLITPRGAGAAIPRGRAVSVLDIGTGASCIYPLIGAREYGWRFVATEVDAAACAWAAGLVAAHPSVADRIECRRQTSPLRCFEGVVGPEERFELSMCNPPFYASAAEAAEGNRRKRRNLGQGGRSQAARNFGGQAGELWCDGGELAFVLRMIAQSAERPEQCRWFTSLVSKSAHLPRLRRALRQVNASAVEVLELAQGQKRSRILAWSFGSARG